jgi:riboflavin synthase
MFTGLIQDLGKVKNISNKEIKVNTLLEIKNIGESISVNGVCLTVKIYDRKSFSADISPKTLDITGLGFLHNGDYVNLEKPLTSQSLMGGHMVQGHIDGITEIIRINKSYGFYKFVLRLPKQLDRYMVVKGSVAVDGISLTIADIKKGVFELWVIPETYRKTNLQYKIVGSMVNIETDIIAKYIEKLGRKYNSSSNITADLLSAEGFL